MLVLLIVLGVVLLLVIFMYNSLVGKKNQVENAFASIDTMLKKRYDLIPNLVNTVKAYMNHEKSVLTEITELRAKAVSGQISNDEKIAVENQLSGAMGKIMVLSENYPDLKANNNFMQLQASWNEIEEQISASRRFFNSAVTDYNNAVEMFPTSIFARMMNYQRKQVFVIPEAERQNVNAGQLFGV
ncbi:MAG: LemA family protein [Cytophagaceae bacterium]|nr:LemA family protein [Cytophagaceae bacterium]